MIECSHIWKVEDFYGGLDFPFNFVLYLLHELNVLFDLEPLIFLVYYINFLYFVFTYFNLGLEMDVFFPKVLNLFVYSLNFDPILFFSQLFVDDEKFFP